MRDGKLGQDHYSNRGLFFIYYFFIIHNIHNGIVTPKSVIGLT